jgi:hypothetical protein
MGYVPPFFCAADRPCVVAKVSEEIAKQRRKIDSDWQSSSHSETFGVASCGGWEGSFTVKTIHAIGFPIRFPPSETA